jgi:ATP-dependent 26S proteasome regulatory subunit
LVAELDDLYLQGDKVVLLAATNYIDIIDRDLLRGGRIDRLIRVDPPNEEDRRQILQLILHKSGMKHTIDLEQAIVATNNMSGSAIKEVIRRTIFKAMNSPNRGVITHEDLMEAIKSS